MPHKIDVTIGTNGDIFVWDTNSIRFLREECRLFGKFIGTVARAPHKTAFKGSPILLGFEELAVLLKEKSDRVRLHVSSSIIATHVCEVSDEIISNYKAALDNNHKEICEIVSEEKLRKSNLHFDNVDKSSSKKRKSESLPQIDKNCVFVHLPTATPLEWLRPLEKETVEVPVMSNLADSITFLISLMKSRSHITRETVVKCSVYYKLWCKGHFVTISCKKMGGNYLLYPGDPWIHHATHVVRMIPSSVEMYPFEWISSIRLVNSLKKICLLAWYNGANIEATLDECDVTQMLHDVNVTFNSFNWCGRTP